MQLHDICVQLLTENENPLPEYGFVKHSKSNQASCHVPSVTGVSFYIRVEALAKDESLAKVPWNKLSVGVYVDKNPDEDVSKDAGCLFSRAGQTEYSFMGREYRREDGKNSLQKWRFVENGLESYFEAVLSLDTPKDSKTTSTGKITIMICQVEDISYSCFPDFCPDKINEKKNMINPGLDHSIGYSDEKFIPRSSTVYVKYIDPDNIPYAKMTFYYQGIPRLRRMGLLVPEKLDMGNEVDSLIMGICKKLDIKNESDSSLKEDSPKTGGSKRKNSACQHMLI